MSRTESIIADVTPVVLREAAEVLGIQDRASLNEIRQNWHEQIKKWHPDVSQQDAIVKQGMEWAFLAMILGWSSTCLLQAYSYG
ncbi:MAG: J domain-containing protein [Methanoregulaceae archaeon]|jgi:hypothetical protein